ncbi:MAG: hypothetical protein DRJ50_08580, partial [Actinobacteria bacterium]
FARLIGNSGGFKLYGSDGLAANLYAIDPLTASASLVGNTGVPSASLAVDPTTGILYAGRRGEGPFLYVINTETAASVPIGGTGVEFRGFDFDADGTLYASVNVLDSGGTGGDALAIIDKETAQVTVIGDFGGGIGLADGLGGIEGIAFDSSGTLYGASAATDGELPVLYAIDPATAGASLIGPIVNASGTPVTGGVASLQFAPHDVLYAGTGRGTGNLIRIDSATGQYTGIGQAVSGSLGGLAGTDSVSETSFISFDPVVGTVPPSSSIGVDVLFDAATLPPGLYGGIIEVATNAPIDPIVQVPANLTVVGVPDISLPGESVMLESTLDYFASGAQTVHSLLLPTVPDGEFIIHLVADGDYGSFGEIATMTAEGIALGSVGPTGTDCTPAEGSFVVGASTAAALAADGVVEVTVQNSGTVDVGFCLADNHTVRLTYSLPVQSMEFGQVYVDYSESRTVLVENLGSADLVISSITSDVPSVTAMPDGLIPDPNAWIIAPHSSGTVTVTYAPTEAGPVAGALTFNCNDPDEPQLTLGFQGSATTAPVAGISPTAVAATAPPAATTPVTEILALSNTGGSDLHWFASASPVVPPGPPPGDWVDQPKGYESDNGTGAYVDHAGGPDGFGYVFKDSHEADGPLFTWYDISTVGTPVALTGDDENSGPIPLGFSFDFYGNTFDAVKVCTNGWLSFTSDKTTYSNPDLLPNVGYSVPENLIAPIWDALDLNGAQGIRYHGDDTRFIVQYTEVSRFSSAAELTFQVVFYSSGRIEFLYFEMSGVLDSATIGIQNADKTVGLLVSYNETYVHDGLAVEFKPLADWVSVAPVFGIVAAGNLEDLVLSLTSAELEQGMYQAVLDVVTNDPVTHVMQVPVSFLVNHSPVAEANADAVHEATSPSGAMVLLDGSASVDLDSEPGTNDDIVLFEWYENYDTPSELLLGLGESLPVMLALGSHPITLKVTDSLGETDLDDVLVSVLDTAAPSLFCSSDRTLEIPANTDPAYTGAAVGQDTCSDVQITWTDSVVPGCGNTLTITRTWVGVDDSNNTSSCRQTIAVVDTTPPDVACAAVEVCHDPGQGPPEEFRLEFGAFDAGGEVAVDGIVELAGGSCGDVPISNGQVIEAGCDGVCGVEFDGVLRVEASSIELVVSAMDACGNAAACSANVCNGGNGDDGDDFGDSLRFVGTAEDRHRLQWHARPHAAGYRIYRATSPLGPFESIGETSTPWFDDEEQPQVLPLFYDVRAVDDCGTEDD